MTDTQPNSELASSLKTDNVFLFVPNLIGYARVILALISFWQMPTNCIAAGFCYLVITFNAH
jgi:CDP-diacylglycerol--inositol 3-phosphatidyltransferase